MKWATAKIGEVCDVLSGATSRTGEPAFGDGDILWATPKDLSDLDRKYLNDTARKITAAVLKSCSVSMLPAQVCFVQFPCADWFSCDQRVSCLYQSRIQEYGPTKRHSNF